MNILDETSGTFDISSEVEVASYICDKTIPTSVLARLYIGSIGDPIVGSGPYYIRAYIDDALLIPDTSISIASSGAYVAHSRQFIMKEGEALTIKLLGNVGDTVIPVSTLILDVTPPTIEEIVEAIDGVEIIVEPGPITDAINQAMSKVVLRPQKVKLGVCSSDQEVSILNKTSPGVKKIIKKLN